MEDLKEYFEGYMKDSIAGELFHGSPKKLDVINPHVSSHGMAYVYASPDYKYALCYAGQNWNDFEINQAYVDGQLCLTEIQKGKFIEKFQRPGYVYHLNKDDFKMIPNHPKKEFISEEEVVPLTVDEIPNVYRRLSTEGIQFYTYPDLPPYIKDRKQYIMDRAKSFYVQDNPQLLEYLCKSFPDMEDDFRSYCTSYTGKGKKSEISTEGVSETADIPGENKSDSDIFIEKKKGSSEKLYFVSESSDWDDGRMMPRIPDNFMTRNGYEDNTTPRVCFSTSIDGCLRALSMNLAGKEFYVYTPDPDGIYDVITPTVKQVPDVKLTHERWITTPVDTVLIGKIKVIKDAGGPPLEYKYGDKTASLYDWEWKWISKRDDSVTKESAGDEIPKVYFTKDITPESLIRLYYKISAGKNLSGNVMVKISTGEPGGHNFLQPSLIGPLVNVVHGTICDANTAYGGPRSTTESHYQVMKDHGFADIAPVDVLDGDGEIEIPVNNGYHLKTLPVGSHNSNYGTFLILTHFKGHAMAGFGGAMKNIAIGMASARGKAIVHSAGKSETEVMGHPQQPFLQSMVDSVKASIDYGGRENFLYINVANNLSVDCDCDAHPADPTMADIGVFASTDPLAIDQACIDAVDRAADNKDLVARIKRQTGRNMLQYAEDAGIGSRKYELIDLDKEDSIVDESTYDSEEFIVLGDSDFYEVVKDLIDKGLYKYTFETNPEVSDEKHRYNMAFHRACYNMTNKEIDSLIDDAVDAVKSIVDEHDGFEIYNGKKPPKGLIYDNKTHKRFILDDDSAYLGVVTFRFPKLFADVSKINGIDQFPKSLLESEEFAQFISVVKEIFIALAKNGFMGALYYGDKGEGSIAIDACSMSVLMSKNNKKFKDLMSKRDSITTEAFKECNTLEDAIDNVFSHNSVVALWTDGENEDGSHCGYNVYHGMAHAIPDKFRKCEIQEIEDILDTDHPDAIHIRINAGYMTPSKFEEFKLKEIDDKINDLFKEYSDPPHREEPMNTTPEQVVPSSHSFLRNNDEEERKPAPGFSSSITKESVSDLDAMFKEAVESFTATTNEDAPIMKTDLNDLRKDFSKKSEENTDESAGVMEVLPYVGVKKDPPPDTDYPGSPFKALEESYETIFEFKNESANETVTVMETPFSPNSVFLNVGDYHYPDIIKELVEDVITDIENGSSDYAEKSNLVWHITGENSEPLCAIADELGFVQIPNIDPKKSDTVTYAMDIQEFTPEKTQYTSEAGADVSNIFRADEDYVYLNVPYCEFYIPTEYFAMGKKFAEDFTEKIHVIGLFNVGIFEDGKLVDVRVFNVPVYLDINVYEFEVRMIDIGSGTPIECRVYKYYQDSIICRAFIAENSGVAQTFLQLIISGNMPGTIPYSQVLSVWRKNLELSGVNLGVSSAIMEMILAVMYRDAKDPSKKYCIRYGSTVDSSEFDYMSASIRQICQYNSTFTGIIYEDIDSMITSAINRNRNGKEEGDTPMEKIIKM